MPYRVIEPPRLKKTANLAAISTSPNKKLHFSCIFRPIALAFSYRVRYSPLGSSFFAQSQGQTKEFRGPPGFLGTERNL